MSAFEREMGYNPYADNGVYGEQEGYLLIEDDAGHSRRAWCQLNGTVFRCWSDRGGGDEAHLDISDCVVEPGGVPGEVMLVTMTGAYALRGDNLDHTETWFESLERSTQEAEESGGGVAQARRFWVKQSKLTKARDDVARLRKLVNMRSRKANGNVSPEPEPLEKKRSSRNVRFSFADDPSGGDGGSPGSRQRGLSRHGSMASVTSDRSERKRNVSNLGSWSPEAQKQHEARVRAESMSSQTGPGSRSRSGTSLGGSTAWGTEYDAAERERKLQRQAETQRLVEGGSPIGARNRAKTGVPGRWDRGYSMYAPLGGRDRSGSSIGARDRSPSTRDRSPSTRDRSRSSLPPGGAQSPASSDGSPSPDPGRKRAQTAAGPGMYRGDTNDRDSPDSTGSGRQRASSSVGGGSNRDTTPSPGQGGSMRSQGGGSTSNTMTGSDDPDDAPTPLYRTFSAWTVGARSTTSDGETDTEDSELMPDTHQTGASSGRRVTVLPPRIEDDEWDRDTSTPPPGRTGSGVKKDWWTIMHEDDEDDAPVVPPGFPRWKPWTTSFRSSTGHATVCGASARAVTSDRKDKKDDDSNASESTETGGWRAHYFQKSGRWPSTGQGKRRQQGEFVKFGGGGAHNGQPTMMNGHQQPMNAAAPNKPWGWGRKQQRGEPPPPDWRGRDTSPHTPRHHQTTNPPQFLDLSSSSTFNDSETNTNDSERGPWSPMGGGYPYHTSPSTPLTSGGPASPLASPRSPLHPSSGPIGTYDPQTPPSVVVYTQHRPPNSVSPTRRPNNTNVQVHEKYEFRRNSTGPPAPGSPRGAPGSTTASSRWGEWKEPPHPYWTRAPPPTQTQHHHHTTSPPRIRPGSNAAPPPGSPTYQTWAEPRDLSNASNRDSSPTSTTKTIRSYSVKTSGSEDKKVTEMKIKVQEVHDTFAPLPLSPHRRSTSPVLG
eukprot:TRINITY_DN64549_c0_g1_i1.p1 TRINITY_DN64549_c0_g1~~TRINITY_DN64549_c0_g1_i1.p1  ORF type:complete len:1026 (+),score=67.25 TRINITY_DN64549_c0_g1_i1:276-3080(+)